MQGFFQLGIGKKVHGTLGPTAGALVSGHGIDRTFGKKVVLIGIVLAEQEPQSDQRNRYEHEGELTPQID